jgi:Flp pilus assembly protein TadG
MLSMKNRLLGGAARIARFGRERSGSITVEMGFAAIAFTMLLTGVISFGSILFIQANMMNAARDTARSIAVGSLAATTTAAKPYAEARMVNWGITYTVTPSTAVIAGVTDVTVEISAPMSQAALIDYMNLFGSKTVRARVSMRSET